MSQLDDATLFLVASLVISVTGVMFILSTLLRRNDPVGRLWSVFFIGSIFSVFAMMVGSSNPDAWWAYPVGHGFYVAALGLIWSGARQANRKRPLLVVPIALGVVVLVARFVAGPDAVSVAGSPEMFLGAAIFFGAAALESGTRELGRLPDGRLLAVLLAIAAVVYAARGVALAILGGESPQFTSIFGATSASLFEIVVAIVGTAALTAVQSERFRRKATLDADFGTTVSIDGIIGRDVFRELAESWLMRSVRQRTTLVLLIIELADLSEVNVAFGRAAGDAAIRLTGRVTLTHAPTASLVGHLSPRRFALLMEQPTTDAVEVIATRVGDAVLSTPVDEQDRFRASTFRGIATTRTDGARFDDLYRAAIEAVRIDKANARTSADAQDALTRSEARG
jgi:GGDEF domain-containing protein